jgi:hypothetical protein
VVAGKIASRFSWTPRVSLSWCPASYMGLCPNDERQIKRWRNMRRHIAQIKSFEDRLIQFSLTTGPR